MTTIFIKTQRRNTEFSIIVCLVVIVVFGVGVYHDTSTNPATAAAVVTTRVPGDVDTTDSTDHMESTEHSSSVGPMVETHRSRETTSISSTSTTNCKNTGDIHEQQHCDHPTKKRWNWNPEDTHPCNIRRYTAEAWQKTRLVSLQQHQQDHDRTIQRTDVSLSLTGTTTTTTNNNHNARSGIVPSLYHVPIIIQQNRTINELFRYKTHRDRILQQFPNNATTFRVTLSSSNALSEHRHTVLFRDYLHTSYTRGGTSPDQLSNESWYLFGETYTQEWHTALLQYYTLPPCHACDAMDNVALSFGIGNRGSGVQWHIHGPGFSEAVHGRKHWILHPPTREPSPQSRSRSARPRTKIVNNNKYNTPVHRYSNDSESLPDPTIPIDHYHKDQSSRYWMEYVYPFLPSKIRQEYYYECTLDPGDMIYFPNHWWHATINLDPYTAFISTFTNEHPTEL